MKTVLVINPTFPTGSVVATRGVASLMDENPDFGDFVQTSLNRHVKRDWGDLTKDDKKSNDQGLKRKRGGDRLLSAYNDDRFPKNGIATIWIITEADRSVTTILFPDEY